jgi:hypothetical protein
LNLARIKFGEIPKDVEHRLIAETDAIKGYGRGEMLLTMWRLVDELRKHDINIRLTLGQGYNVSLVCYLLGISSFNPIDHPGIKTESSPIVKITKPSSKSHIIVSLQGDPEIIEGKGLESFDDDIDNIENWIRQNRDNLLAYWTHEIDSDELSERWVYAGRIQYI